MIKNTWIFNFGFAISLATLFFVPSIEAKEIGNKLFSITVPDTWENLSSNTLEDSSNLTVDMGDEDFVHFLSYMNTQPLSNAQLNIMATIIFEVGDAEITLDSRIPKIIGGKEFNLYSFKLLEPATPEEAEVRISIYLHKRPTFQYLTMLSYGDSASGQVLTNTIETALATLKFSGSTSLAFRKNLKHTKEAFQSFDILGRNQTLQSIPTPQLYKSIGK